MRSPLRTSRGGRSRCHSTLHAVIVPAVPTGQVASRRMRALGKGAQRLPEQVVDAQGHVAAPDGRLLGNAERDDDGGVEGVRVDLLEAEVG